jgi:hypothetical protein
MKLNFTKSLSLIGIVFLSFLFACSTDTDKKLWDESVLVNTTPAYQSYLSQFPDGKFADEANDKVQDLMFGEAGKSNDVIPLYDEYVKLYPNGKYLGEFETLMYEQAKEKNTLSAFENYAGRFPKGKYLGEVETLLYEGILSGESTMNTGEYLNRFPESNHKGDIEQMMFDSLVADPTMARADTFLVYFPEGQHTEEVNLMLEDIYFKNAVGTNARYAMRAFINKFPRSEHVKKIVFNIDPGEAVFKVSDDKDAIIYEGAVPDTFLAVENTVLSISIEQNGFKPFAGSYLVSANPVQVFKKGLKPIISFVYQNGFSKTGSPFIGTGKKFSFELYDNNKLYCKTKQQQFQNIKSFNIDFGKDFVIEVKFKFINSPNYSKSYFGLLWGSDNLTRYYFATIDGKLSFGDQDNNLRSTENSYGYTKWSSAGGKNDTWSSYEPFNQNNYNTLRIEKSGKSYIYSLNGSVFHRDNVFSKPKGDKIGFGIGSAEVLVDYFNIQQ